MENPNQKRMCISFNRSTSGVSVKYDLAVFDFTPVGMRLVETQEGVKFSEIFERAEESLQ
jgi:acyl CoA:acetate/3-ketoacid CoA transferase beta subunit